MAVTGHMWLFNKFKLHKIEDLYSVPQSYEPTLKHSWPHAAGGYCIGRGGYRTFPASKKVLLDSTVSREMGTLRMTR